MALVGAGAGMNGSAGVSALPSLSPASLRIQRLPRALWQLQEAFLYSALQKKKKKKPGRFPAGFDLAVGV